MLIMTYKTPHGLKPAYDFIKNAIMKEAGMDVCVQYIPHNHTPKIGFFRFKRKEDPRLIELIPQSFEWKNKDQQPDDVDWSLFPLTFYPSISETPELVRIIHFELLGLEKVPGLSRSNGLPWTSLNGSKYGLYLTSSPLIKEYRRRHILENAVIFQKQVEKRIKTCKTSGPYMLDD